MARGGPDYKASNSYYGQSLTDVGELAARIGSIDLLDRKGVVIYHCLLYTSPSPRDGLLSRMPSSA